MFCVGDFPGNFLLRVRLTSGVWVSGWKAVLGLVSRSQEEAQRLSPVQLKGILQTKMRPVARTQARSQCLHGLPFIRQDGGRTGFVSFSSFRDKEAWEVWIYRLNSGWWRGFVKENQIPSLPLLQIQKRGKRQVTAGPRSTTGKDRKILKRQRRAESGPRQRLLKQRLKKHR